MIKHKQLLEKYIRHIWQCECIDFVTEPGGHSDIVFTDEEVEFFEMVSRMISAGDYDGRAT